MVFFAPTFACFLLIFNQLPSQLADQLDCCRLVHSKMQYNHHSSHYIFDGSLKRRLMLTAFEHHSFPCQHKYDERVSNVQTQYCTLSFCMSHTSLPPLTIFNLIWFIKISPSVIVHICLQCITRIFASTFLQNMATYLNCIVTNFSNNTLSNSKNR